MRRGLIKWRREAFVAATEKVGARGLGGAGTPKLESKQGSGCVKHHPVPAGAQ